MVVRTISAIVLAAVALPLLLFGGWFAFGLSFVAVGIATYEILTLPGRKRYNAGIWILTYVAMYVLVYWQFIKINSNFNLDTSLLTNFFYLDSYSVSIMAMVLYLLALFVFSFFWENFRIEDIFYLFTMVFLVSMGFYSLLFERYFPVSLVGTSSTSLSGFIPNIATSLFFFFVFVGVFMSDIGAYFVGVLFGKHPMNVRISPHKTWEGFVGGVVLSLLYSFTFVAICDVWLKQPLIPGVIDVSASPTDWGYVTLFALIIPILDNVGGFLFSAMKRRYNAKDWGKIIPGHGGILDRLDGALVTSTAMSMLVYMISVDWKFMV